MRILFFITLILIAVSAKAETTWSYERVLARLQSVTSLRAHFVQEKTVQALSRPLRSEGIFRYDQHDGIRWETEKPFRSLCWISKDGISRQTSQGKETISVADNPALERITNLFLSLFLANKETLESNFVTKFLLKNGGWELILTPKDSFAAKVISTLTLEGSDYVNVIALKEQSGDHTKIAFSAQTTDNTAQHNLEERL